MECGKEFQHNYGSSSVLKTPSIPSFQAEESIHLPSSYCMLDMWSPYKAHLFTVSLPFVVPFLSPREAVSLASVLPYPIRKDTIYCSVYKFEITSSVALSKLKMFPSVQELLVSSLTPSDLLRLGILIMDGYCKHIKVLYVHYALPDNCASVSSLANATNGNMIWYLVSQFFQCLDTAALRGMLRNLEEINFQILNEFPILLPQPLFCGNDVIQSISQYCPKLHSFHLPICLLNHASNIWAGNENIEILNPLVVDRTMEPIEGNIPHRRELSDEENKLWNHPCNSIQWPSMRYLPGFILKETPNLPIAPSIFNFNFPNLQHLIHTYTFSNEDCIDYMTLLEILKMKHITTFNLETFAISRQNISIEIVEAAMHPSSRQFPLLDYKVGYGTEISSLPHLHPDNNEFPTLIMNPSDPFCRSSPYLFQNLVELVLSCTSIDTPLSLMLTSPDLLKRLTLLVTRVSKEVLSDIFISFTKLEILTLHELIPLPRQLLRVLPGRQNYEVFIPGKEELIEGIREGVEQLVYSNVVVSDQGNSAQSSFIEDHPPPMSSLLKISLDLWIWGEFSTIATMIYTSLPVEKFTTAIPLFNSLEVMQISEASFLYEPVSIQIEHFARLCTLLSLGAFQNLNTVNYRTSSIPNVASQALVGDYNTVITNSSARNEVDQMWESLVTNVRSEYQIPPILAFPTHSLFSSLNHELSRRHVKNLKPDQR